VKLFIGIEVPPDIKKQVLAIQGEEQQGVNWYVSEKLHITLVYIGDVAEKNINKIKDTLEDIEFHDFDLKLEGSGGIFYAGNRNYVWLNVNHSDGFENLREAVLEGLNNSGIQLMDYKNAPHLTIAKFKDFDQDKVEAFKYDCSSFCSKAFNISSFVLYQTVSDKKDVSYKALKSFPCGVSG